MDIETTGLDYLSDKITIIGIYGGPGKEIITYDPMDVEALLHNNPHLKVTGHNFKFDSRFLIKAGVSEELLMSRWAWDSMHLASVCTIKPEEEYLKLYEEIRREINKTLPKGKGHRDAGPLSLKVQAPWWLGVPAFWEATTDHNDIQYVLKDARYTWELTQMLYNICEEEKGLKTAQDLIARAKVVLRGELTGIKLDLPLLDKMTEETKVELEEAERHINDNWAEEFKEWGRLQEATVRQKYEGMCRTYSEKHCKNYNDTWDNKYKKLYEKAVLKIEPLNLASPAQLTWLLRDALGMDITGLDGEESTDKEVLNMLAAQHPEVKDLLKFREKSKILSAFLPEYKEFAKYDGRIHTTFNITGARTGRTSSSTPNLQQVPGRLHDLFIADEGHLLVTRDMSSLEPTLIAYFSEDDNLCDIVLNQKNFHSINALIIFPELNCEVSEIKKKYPSYRDAAKELGLSVLYGAGANRVHQSLTKRGFNFTKDRCSQIVKEIRTFYKGVWAFKQELDLLAESGEIFYNLLGRPLRFINKDDVYMKAFNTLIQGSGSDILMNSSLDIAASGYIKPLLWVHDEIVCLVPEERLEDGVKTIETAMTKFDLTNAKGPIRLRVEGGNDKRWKK